MMIDPPIDKLTEKAEGNKYMLAALVSNRAKKLAAGDKPLVPVKEKDKPISIAAKEIYEDKITYKKK